MSSKHQREKEREIEAIDKIKNGNTSELRDKHTGQWLSHMDQIIVAAQQDNKTPII